MRAVAGGNLAQPIGTQTDLTDRVKIEVANAADALVDLSEFAVSLEYDQSADEIVDGATVVFRRLEGANSLAPLMTASPPVALGRRLVVSINAGSGSYKEVFRGKIDDVDWPERFGDVTIQCRDQAGVAADTWIETGREYGSEAGVSLETVMQAVATDNLTAPPTLYFPAATGAVVQHLAGDPPYGPTEQSVLDAERALAESYGGTIRWRNYDASPSDWKWSVFTPSRTKTVADHTFGTSDYWDVTTIRQSIEDIRNVVEVGYVADGVQASVTVSDSASITKYGRRYMKITEGSDSPVNNLTLATALANAALSDLKEPDALLEITGRYFWPGEIGVDLYTFTANNKHFSTDQTLAVMAFRHRIAIGERPTTKILTRGKPSGGVLMWRRRLKLTLNALPLIPTIRVSNFREVARTDTTVTFGWDVAGTITELWLYLSTPAQPVATDPWAVLTGAPSARLTAATVEYTVSIPAVGLVTYGRLVPIDVDVARGQSWDFTVQGEGLDPVSQGTVAISMNGSVEITVDGPAWVASHKYATSLSAFPSEATVLASGTTVDGRQMSVSLAAATLALGATIFVTVIPFSLAGATGFQGTSIKLRGTRHDTSATKTVSMGVAGLNMNSAAARAATRHGGGYLETFGITSYFEIYPSVSINLPDGVTVTELTLTGYADNGTFGAGQAATGLALRRVNGDGTETLILTAIVAGSAGYSTATASGSETTAGRKHRLHGFMDPTALGTGTLTPPDGACRMVNYSYTYSMPSTINAL